MQHARGELGNGAHHAALMVNDRRNPCIGGAQHGSIELQGTHPADLQMLVGGDGITEPGIVGHIDQEGAGFIQATLGTEGVLIADGRPHPLAMDHQRRLPQRPGLQVFIGQAQQLQEGLAPGRQGKILPEWHQMPLEVDAPVPAQGQQGIAVLRPGV